MKHRRFFLIVSSVLTIAPWTFNKTLAADEAEIRILLLGDSTTRGSLCHSVEPKGPHLEDVIRLLLSTDKDLPPVQVANRGIDGATIRSFMREYDSMLKKHGDADYVFIRFGVNDYRRHKNFTQSFPKDYRDLLARLRHDVPQATLIPTTNIPYMDAERDAEVNALIRQIADQEQLAVFDLYPRYQKELSNGPNALNYRHFSLEKVPPQHHAWLKPFLRNGRVTAMDNRLDVHFGHLEGWYDDRHPNLAGYHVIGDETAKYLTRLIREKQSAAAKK